MARLGLLLVQMIAPLTVVIAGLTLLALGFGETGTREALRATARISLVAFVLAFMARPVHDLTSSAFSAWLLRNRSLIGMCFGFSLTAHLLLISWLIVVRHPDWPEVIGPLDIAIGGPGLLIVMAMTITSFPRVRRKVSASSWKRLHTIGLYLVWFIYTACLVSSFVEKSPPYPAWHYTPLIGVLILAMLIRVLVAIQRRSMLPTTWTIHPCLRTRLRLQRQRETAES